jgi:hypothetical protein
MEDIKSNATADLKKILKKKPSAGTSNNCSIDGASVHKGPTLEVIR